MSLASPVQGSGFESGYHVFPVRRQHQLGGGALSSEQVDLLLGGAPEATSAGRGRSVQAGEIPRRRGFQGDLLTKRCCSFFLLGAAPSSTAIISFFTFDLRLNEGPYLGHYRFIAGSERRYRPINRKVYSFYVRAAN